MRIQGIDAIAIEIPLTRNFGGSTYAVVKRAGGSRNRATGTMTSR